MNNEMSLRLGLDDLLADLWHARRTGDLGRLALIAYCEVRRWARDAGNLPLAERASGLITSSPHRTREAFLEQIDALVRELEQVQSTALESPAPAIGRTAEPARSPDAMPR